MDDTALVCEQENGLFIITGCSHSGICNIMEYAKQVCQNSKITGVLGGFHLFKKDEQLAKTIDYFEKNSVENIFPSHCVSFEAKAHIHSRIPVHETGVGMVLNI